MATTYVSGRYQAEVLTQGFTEARTGTPGFYLQLKILRRYDSGGNLQPCPQYERTYSQYFKTEIGLKILLADLRTLGVQITDLAQLEPSVQGHISLVGRKIDVVCDNEVNDGKERERWGIPRLRSLTAGAVRALGERFNHLLRNEPSQTQPEPPPPPALNVDTRS